MKKIDIFAGIRIAMVSIIVSYLGFLGLEPMVARAATDTDTTIVSLTVSKEISVTVDSSTASLGTLGGVAGGFSTLSPAVTWTVKTNDITGYTLAINKNQKLLTGSGGTSFTEFSDYPTGTPLAYSFDTSDATKAYFGFVPSAGNDFTSAYRHTSGTCGGATLLADHCVNGITATNQTIASSVDETSGTGTTTAITLKAWMGGSHVLQDGSYTTTITATATTNS